MRKQFCIIVATVAILFVSCKKDPEIFEEIKLQKLELDFHLSWGLASMPYTEPGYYDTTLVSGFNRAHINWFTIDTIFYGSLKPVNISADDISNHFARQIQLNEIYGNGFDKSAKIFNLVYYPNIRGQYNYETTGTNISAGVDFEGFLKQPSTRWGGIQRHIFLNSNVFQYIDFWLLDPFIYEAGIQGDLYFNLGEINEDVLPDRKLKNEALALENDSSLWSVLYTSGDYGLDGLTDFYEQYYFFEILKSAKTMFDLGFLSEYAFQFLWQDPSSDFFAHYLNPAFDSIAHAGIINRYRFFNGCEGNLGRAVIGVYPDKEDFNRNEVLDTLNNYNEYKISIRKADFVKGSNFITETLEKEIELPNGTKSKVNWYKFRIPLSQKSNRIGIWSESDPVKDIRIYLKGFENSVVLRFEGLSLSN